MWNLHEVRKSRNDQLQFGRPISLYTLPELYETRDYRQLTNEIYVQACKEECVFKTEIPCDKDVYELCCHLIRKNGWQKANDAISARELYIQLREEILHLL